MLLIDTCVANDEPLPSMDADDMIVQIETIFDTSKFNLENSSDGTDQFQNTDLQLEDLSDISYYQSDIFTANYINILPEEHTACESSLEDAFNAELDALAMNFSDLKGHSLAITLAPNISIDNGVSLIAKCDTAGKTGSEPIFKPSLQRNDRSFISAQVNGNNFNNFNNDNLPVCVTPLQLQICSECNPGELKNYKVQEKVAQIHCLNIEYHAREEKVTSSEGQLIINQLKTSEPPPSPEVVIICKVISLVNDGKYSERVNKSIQAAIANIRQSLSTVSSELIPSQYRLLDIEEYIQSYASFLLPNGYSVWDFANVQGIGNWIYTKNSLQKLDKLPLRMMNHKVNFYEPIVKRTRVVENMTVREALCPYCPVDLKNLDRCFFNTDGCSYQHHVSRNHGVWNKGYEMPPPIVLEKGPKSYISVCPMCNHRPGIFKLTTKAYIYDGCHLYNSFISYHKHLITKHNITKKGRTPQQISMDKKWFVDEFSYKDLLFELQLES